MAKATTACSSATALLQLGDADGASNRAYYAMFDAARAALLASGAAVEADLGRTHSGLIGMFGQLLVKNGPIPREIGRLLNRAHEVRLMADYDSSSVQTADAQRLVEEAQAFVSAMKAQFMPDKPEA